MDSQIFKNSLNFKPSDAHKLYNSLYEFFSNDEQFLDWLLNSDIIFKSQNDAFICYLNEYLSLDAEGSLSECEDGSFSFKKNDSLFKVKLSFGEFVVSSDKSMEVKEFSTPTEMLDYIEEL